LIHLDGSYGEGGGQILRTALALSSVIGIPFEVINIRKGRRHPGLKPQHLTGVRAAARITQARVEGDELGSERLRFEPSGLKGGEYEFDVAELRESAGAVTLVAQTILPLLFHASIPSRVRIRGGTHVPFSPPFEYLAEVLLPTLYSLGYSAQARIERYGFYPVGGGEILLWVKPTHLHPSEFEALERGELRALHLISGVVRLARGIAEREGDRIRKHYENSGLGVKLEVEVREMKALSPGNYLFLRDDWQRIRTGFSALGSPGKPAERVADELWDDFKLYLDSSAVLDPHLADQLLCFLALGRLKATFLTKPSSHLRTNAWVISQFMEGVQVTIEESGKVTVGD
jgi:RNA 3'-terminal phosphate cyclase (ATP)